MKHFVLAQKNLIGRDVLLLTLEPQSPDDVLEFEAGQYVAIGFKRNGRRTPVRSFSIVSSPRDTSKLEVAMRIQGGFTATAKELHEGDPVYVQGPFGDFTVNPDYDRRVVMLAGGIGITPFMSIVRWAAEVSLPVPITLLYSCRHQADIPFYTELLALQRRNPNFRVAFFITSGAIVPEAGVSIVPGSIEPTHLEQITNGEFRGVTYFTCGPVGFMKTQEKTLRNHEVPADRIISESFAQSSKLFGGERWSPTSLTYAFATILLLAGVGGIMLLDLLRSVPAFANDNDEGGAQSTTGATQTQNASTPATTNSATTTDPNATNNTSTSNQTNYNYTPPMSRMS